MGIIKAVDPTKQSQYTGKTVSYFLGGDMRQADLQVSICIMWNLSGCRVFRPGSKYTLLCDNTAMISTLIWTSNKRQLRIMVAV